MRQPETNFGDKANKKGRPKGALNKKTAEIKAIAGKYGPDAIQVLVRIMERGESEGSRVAAAKELLDRAYGKAPQALDVAQATHITFGWEE